MCKRIIQLIGCAFTVALTCSPVFSQDYFVEVSSSAGSDNLWSRVGLLKKDTGAVEWGNKVKFAQGNSPCVATDGTVAVLVYKGGEDKLLYHVGDIDHETMTVSWGPAVSYDSGQGPSISIKGGQIVEVHQAKSSEKLWILMGTIDSKKRQIAWGKGVQYDAEGRGPAISFEK